MNVCPLMLLALVPSMFSHLVEPSGVHMPLPQSWFSEPLNSVLIDESTKHRMKSSPGTSKESRHPVKWKYKPAAEKRVETSGHKPKHPQRRKSSKASPPFILRRQSPQKAAPLAPTTPSPVAVHTNSPTHRRKSSSKRPPIYLIKDVYNGSFSRPHPERCPARGAHTRVLILVTSAPAHRAERDGVRASWGRFAQRGDIAFAFVLGEPPDGLRASIEAEDALNGDLIIGHSEDIYSTLPLKTLSMLEWAVRFCPLARFLFKTDDDVFVSVSNLLQFIDDPQREGARRTIYGRLWHKAAPTRKYSDKSFIPVREYPYPILPDFTAGSGYLVTGDAIRPLLAAAMQHQYVRLEDVLFTGILAEEIGIRRENVDALVADDTFDSDPCLRITTHNVSGTAQLDLWLKQFGIDSSRSHQAPGPILCPQYYNVRKEPEITERTDYNWERRLYH